MLEAPQSFESDSRCRNHTPFHQMSFDAVSVSAIHQGTRLHGSQQTGGMSFEAATARQAFVSLILVVATFEGHLCCNHPLQKCLVTYQWKWP